MKRFNNDVIINTLLLILMLVISVLVIINVSETNVFTIAYNGFVIISFVISYIASFYHDIKATGSRLYMINAYLLTYMISFQPTSLFDLPIIIFIANYAIAILGSVLWYKILKRILSKEVDSLKE